MSRAAPSLEKLRDSPTALIASCLVSGYLWLGIAGVWWLWAGDLITERNRDSRLGIIGGVIDHRRSGAVSKVDSQRMRAREPVVPGRRGLL